jgi:Zn finger protein HypA/HybF involved in hydrogenase expression
MFDQQERMRSLIEQALAEARRTAPEARIAEIHLDLFTGIDEAGARALFEAASRATPAEGASLVLKPCGTRYICWNCCGMRFEGWEGVCPNCGEDGLEVPDEIAFALRKVITE